MREYRLNIGEAAAIRPRWWGKSWSVIYAGMLEDGTCSVVVMWTMGYNSAAYNLYLGRGQREFQLPFGTAAVVELSPNELQLRFDEHARR
jgi:hypothetical protein